MNSLASTLLKYLLKRWTLPLLGGVLFFSGLLIANDMVQLSQEIFSQGAPIEWLLPIILTTFPETLALVLPMAAILGGLLGTQQLSEGSEMVASQGLGVGMRSILKAWALLSLGLILLASLNAHLIVPNMGQSIDKIENRMAEDTKTRFLKPGAAPFFPSQNPESGVWVAPSGEIHLFEVTHAEVQHLVAKDLSWHRQGTQGEKASIILKLQNLKGCYYQKSNGSVGLLDQQSQILKIDLPSRPAILAPTPVRYLSTLQLLKTRTKDCWIELGRRITLPFSTVAFLLLGIALGLEHPRFRKGGALVRSLGVILVYYLIMKFSENWYLAEKGTEIYLFMPPLILLLVGILVLFWKMQPHRASRFSITNMYNNCINYIEKLKYIIFRSPELLPVRSTSQRPILPSSPGILGRWTRRLWWRNWGATLGTLLTLDLLIEFARLAAELSKNGLPYSLFVKYWLWNLPSFLIIAFPVSFLLGGVLAFSDAAVAREWVALRAGGASLLQWIGSGAKAWVSILLISLVMQAVVAPAVLGRADSLHRTIKNKPDRIYQSKPWMHLTSSEVLWFLEKDYRWGFTLKSPGQGPILYRWKRDTARADQLPWDRLHFESGPEASKLFPNEALRRSSRAEETSTLDLLLWQKWAPDAERATMFWGRLLDWLAGPCLMFAMLAFTFPAPRRGRGQVLGVSLVIGLLFLGMQALLGGAARAGEIPALWGVVAPLLVLLGTGFVNLKRLKT